MEAGRTCVILDSSALMAWLMPDESLPSIDELMDQVERNEVQAWVQPLFYQELANALLMAERRGRLPKGTMVDYVENILALRLNLSHYPTQPAGLARSIELADKHSLSLYDASYLALALHLQSPLATLDEKLAAAALRENLLWANG